MRAYRFFTRLLLMVLSTVLPSSALAGDAEAEKKVIGKIVLAIETVPSLYEKYQGPAKPQPIPKYPANKLAAYAIDKQQSVDNERARYQADRKEYAKAFPLRAAVFDAVEVMQAVQKSPIRRVLPSPITPKAKAAFLVEQQPLGVNIFKFEKVLTAMNEADEQGAKETSKYWQATYDTARARMEANIVFLFEYNFTLGMIRADMLPELGAGDDGWRIAFTPKVTVPEGKAKNLARANKKRWEKIQADYPGTPWAYFAERESQRSIGMQWVAKKT